MADIKYLMDENLEQLIAKNKRLFIFLDYDGTITDLVERPAFAFLDRRTKSLLRKISKSRNFVLGIISGRSLKDIKRRVGLSDILYAGNHGLELSVKGKDILCDKKITKAYKSALAEIRAQLKTNLADIKDLIFEDKGIIIALHYRLVSDEDIKKLKTIFKKTLAPYIKEKLVKVGKGKKLLEVKPHADFSKFDALKFFEDKFKKKTADRTIYIGDDITDEDIFSQMGQDDISIVVGNSKKTKAKYFLNDPYEVERFLSGLIDFKKS